MALESDNPADPTLDELLNQAFDGSIGKINTGIPGEIITYDSSSGTAEVQISIKRQYDGEEPFDIPPLINVPVSIPMSSAGKAYLSVPIKKGDTGLIHFCHRSIDRWLQQGGQVEPGDTRRFDISDAVFVPGLSPTSNRRNFDTKNVELKNDRMSIIMHPDGKIEIKGRSEDFLKIVDELITALINSTMTGGPGPGGAIISSFDPLVTIPLFELIQSKLGTLIP